MPIEHDQYLFLGTAVDATHGDVDVVVAVDEVHARHIGRQHFLQVTGTAVVNHVSGNERGGHRHLGQRFRLTGGGGNGGSHTGLDTIHHIGKGRRIARRRGIVRILLQQHCGVLLSLLHIETGQIAERNETERVLALIATEGGEMLQQTIAGLFNAAYLVVALSLSVYVAQLRINLSGSAHVSE